MPSEPTSNVLPGKNSDPALPMTTRPPVRRTILLAAGFYVVVAVLCTFVPLFDHPGFEFAFIIGAIAPLIAGRITIRQAWERYRGAARDEHFGVFGAYARSLAVNLGLLLIPLAIILLNGVRVPLCDVGEGVAFFVLLPVMGVVFAVGFAIFCVVHYRWPTFAFGVFVVGTIAYALYLGYATPAIFSYGLFYGYFPGFTYDELLPLEWPLILFRVLTLGATAMFLWLSWLIARHSAPDDSVVRKGFTLIRTLWRDHLQVSLAIGAMIFLVLMFRCELRWAATERFIRERLGGVKETVHFTICYDSATVAPAEVERMAAEHEFQLSRLQAQFGLRHTGRITSFVYPSADAKRRYIGAGETELAKPWSRQIHITRQSLDATLKHELIHVLAAPYGMPVIHASTSPGLTEGLAIGVEGVWGGRTLAEHAALLRRAGLMPDIERMLGATGFVAQSSSVSYVVAGAFVRHLIDRYGMERFLQLYHDPSYQDVYARPLSGLIADWERSLDSVAVDMADTAAVDVLFRRPPLIGNVCVRLYARRMREARRLVTERRYDAALPLYRTLASMGGYDAVAGLLTVYARQQDHNAVLDLYDSLVTHDPHPARYLPLAIAAGDAAWAIGDPLHARALYGTVRAAHITPSLSEAAAARLLALGDTVAASGFRTFFLSDASDTTRAMLLSAPSNTGADSLRWFLRGRLLMRLQWYADARALLQRASFLGADPVLESARCVSLGDAALRSGAYQEARAAYWSARNHDTRPAAAIEIDERIARCEYLEHHQ